jgi:hypothetical protein
MNEAKSSNINLPLVIEQQHNDKRRGFGGAYSCQRDVTWVGLGAGSERPVPCLHAVSPENHHIQNTNPEH